MLGKTLHFVLAPLLALALLGACTVQLVPAYDPELVKGLNDANEPFAYGQINKTSVYDHGDLIDDHWSRRTIQQCHQRLPRHGRERRPEPRTR